MQRRAECVVYIQKNKINKVLLNSSNMKHINSGLVVLIRLKILINSKAVHDKQSMLNLLNTVAVKDSVVVTFGSGNCSAISFRVKIF